MAQKKIPYLRVVEPPEDPKEVKKKVRRLHKEKVKDILAIVILAALAVCGTYRRSRVPEQEERGTVDPVHTDTESDR